MSTLRIGLAAVGIVTVIGYALGSGYWVSNDSGWYRSLVQPSWQPPDWVFGVIWPYNFIMLGIVSYVVASRASLTQAWLWLGFFILSVVAALVWSYLFYVPHNIGLSAVALGLAALLTVPVLVVTFQTALTYGWLLLPYQIWLIVATSLAVGYAQQN